MSSFRVQDRTIQALTQPL